MGSAKKGVTSPRAIGVGLAVATAVLVGFGSIAAAAPATSGDPRATAFSGNVLTCGGAGISGTIVIGSASGSGAQNNFIEVASDGTYLDMRMQTGGTLSGAVVVGVSGYNVYTGRLFVNASAEDLHAPLAAPGDVPPISHWFMCSTEEAAAPPAPPTGTAPAPSGTAATTTASTTDATKAPVTTTSETTTTETTTTDITTTDITTTDITTTETTATPGATAGRTPTAAVAGATSNIAGLANTGAGPSPTTFGLLSTGLVALGAGLLLLPRHRITFARTRVAQTPSARRGMSPRPRP